MSLKLVCITLILMLYIGFSAEQVILCPSYTCEYDECRANNPCRNFDQCFIETCGCAPLCSCTADSSCKSGEYCRIYNITTSLYSCTEFAKLGQRCGGNYIPSAINLCIPDLKCIYPAEGAPGTCQVPCDTWADCPGGYDCIYSGSINGGYCRYNYGTGVTETTVNYTPDEHNNASSLYPLCFVLLLFSLFL